MDKNMQIIQGNKKPYKNGTVNPQAVALARKSRGLDPRELSKMVGISLRDMKKIEKGELEVPNGLLEKFASALGYTKPFFKQDIQIYTPISWVGTEH